MKELHSSRVTEDISSFMGKWKPMICPSLQDERHLGSRIAQSLDRSYRLATSKTQVFPCAVNLHPKSVNQ